MLCRGKGEKERCFAAMRRKKGYGLFSTKAVLVQGNKEKKKKREILNHEYYLEENLWHQKRKKVNIPSFQKREKKEGRKNSNKELRKVSPPEGKLLEGRRKWGGNRRKKKKKTSKRTMLTKKVLIVLPLPEK